MRKRWKRIERDSGESSKRVKTVYLGIVIKKCAKKKTINRIYIHGRAKILVLWEKIKIKGRIKKDRKSVV